MELSVSAGDLVLFSRPCVSMDLGSSLICLGAKLFSGSSIDHVGIVVRDPTTSELLLLEANAKGVSLRSLVTRIMRSKSRIISIRKLFRKKANSQDEVVFQQRLWSLAQRYIHYGYNGSVETNAQAVVRSHLHHILHQPHQDRNRLTYTLNLLQREAAYANETLLPLMQLRCQQLQHQLAAFEQEDRTAFASIDALQRTNCSQLVAQIYTELGVLTPTREVLHYIPADLSSLNSTHTLHLEDEYALSPNLTFDKSLVKIHQSHGVAYLKIASPTQNTALQFNFSEGNTWSLGASAKVVVKHGLVHVFDRDQRLVAEINEKDSPLTCAKGCTLHAFRRSVIAISSSDDDESISTVEKPVSVFIQRECLAGIDTFTSGGFVEVGVSQPLDREITSRLE